MLGTNLHPVLSYRRILAIIIHPTWRSRHRVYLPDMHWVCPEADECH